MHRIYFWRWIFEMEILIDSIVTVCGRKSEN